MSSNLVVPVPREMVQRQINILNDYLHIATNVTSMSSIAQINLANRNLYMAKSLFEALRQFKMLGNWAAIEEDINRIEDKIEFIRKEKSKHYRPEVR